jgi:hypothetical protein
VGIQIIEVSSKKEIKQFIKLQFDLYKGNPYFVPPLIRDEIEIFSRSKNPAYAVCDGRIFLALKDGVPAGRIMAINNKPANKKWGTKDLRFNWFECINDYDVAAALLNNVEEWANELKMETISGPHGFCDFDPQGLLIEGFDKLATIASFYGMPYYKDMFEKYGYEKEIDYVEFLSTSPEPGKFPEKLERMSKLILERYNYKVLEFRNLKEVKKRAWEMFDLLEESFSEIYGTVPMTKEQTTYYYKKYIPFVNKDLVKFVVNHKDELIGFTISMPSLSKAQQKANGRLFPFGIFHLLKGLKTHEILDFYFAGVRKDYRGLGVDTLISTEIAKSALKMGFKYAESNQELENNSKIQALWKFFNPVMHKRRRVFTKMVNG